VQGVAVVNNAQLALRQRYVRALDGWTAVLVARTQEQSVTQLLSVLAPRETSRWSVMRWLTRTLDTCRTIGLYFL
jgi:hypothetical protein